MEILKFLPESWRQWDLFYAFLDKELKVLQEKGFTWRLESEEGVSTLYTDGYPEYLSVTEALVTHRHFFSTALAEFIVEELEEDLIIHIIKNDFGYMLDSQIKSIARYSGFILSYKEDQNERDELKVVERKCKIFKKAYEYLEEEREFNFQGFLRFRLKEYQEELTKVVEYAVDEYIMDQEYQEFIQLLRYFISKQECKVPAIHVYHIQDRQFMLFNEQGKRMTDEEIQYYMQTWGNEAISYEDIIVSTLITINPAKITLHTHEPNQTVIQTLKNIFDYKINICTQCPLCTHWENQNNIEETTFTV